MLLFDDFGETFLIIQVSGSRPNSGVSQAAWEGPDGEVMQVKVFKKKQVFEEEKMFQLDATALAMEEEEEDGEPLVKGEDDIPKGCWYLNHSKPGTLYADILKAAGI